jgi:hypothetical protein
MHAPHMTPQSLIYLSPSLSGLLYIMHLRPPNIPHKIWLPVARPIFIIRYCSARVLNIIESARATTETARVTTETAQNWAPFYRCCIVKWAYLYSKPNSTQQYCNTRHQAGLYNMM